MALSRMARKGSKRKKKKTGKLRWWTLLLAVVAIAGIGAWLSSQTEEERSDSIVWLEDLVRWAQGGFKGPLPQRPLRIAYEYYLDEHVFAGRPEPSDGLRLLPRIGYLVAYDETRRNPAWVAYRLGPRANFPAGDRPDRFITDQQTRARVSHNEYSGSRYDRGHMAPNYAIATRYGRKAQIETFLMSNVVPQDPDLNQGPWREIEHWIANDYASRFDTIYVITGPIYDDQIETLDSGVEIPDAFFKIAVGLKKGKVDAVAFIAEQDVERGERFDKLLTTIDDIESKSGFDFFSLLPDDQEEELESKRRHQLR